MLFARKKVVTAALCCCICSIHSPVLADRAVGAVAPKSKRNYFSLRKRQKGYVGGDQDGGKVRVRPKRTKASLLTRSFILVCIFYVIKFIMPYLVKYISQLCRDISEFKRSMGTHAREMRETRRQKNPKKKPKPRERGGNGRGGRQQSTAAASDAQSISPSVMSILDMHGEYDDDDESSFISAVSSVTSISTMFRGFVSRRSWTSSLAVASESREIEHSTPDRQRPKSKSAARSKNTKASRNKKQTYRDEESTLYEDDTTIPSVLPNYNLHHIEEDDVSTNNKDGEAVVEKRHRSKDRHQYKKKQSNEWLEDASHIPISNVKSHKSVKHGYNPRRTHGKSSGSALERKLSAGSSHEKTHHHNKHSTRNERQNGHKSHHRRDRTK